ncbi:MAG: hypothetical protein ABI679_03115 [Gemmatimonadota bacterium]
MRFSLLVVATSLMVASAHAQDPGGMGGPGGGYGRRGSPSRPPAANPLAERALRPPEPSPPPADTMTTILSLDSTQRERYSAGWDSLIRDIQPMRDSMAAQADIVRSAIAQGYQDAARDRIATIDRMAKAIHKRNELFDHSLRDYLTKDQVKLYQKFRDDHKARPLPTSPGNRSRF